MNILITALFSVFVNILKNKDGPSFFIFKDGCVNFFKKNCGSFVNKILSCDFCTSFWASGITSIFISKNFEEFIINTICGTALSTIMLGFIGRLP